MSKPDYAQTVKVARSEVGYLEKKSNSKLNSKTANAGYNNYTKYGRDMHKLYPAVMDFPAAWCDCFVDWCIYQACGLVYVDAKTALCGNFDDYTVASADYYKAKKRWGTKPKLGAQVFFKDSNGGICHTGIVFAYGPTQVRTVEGNTSSSPGVVANGGCVAEKAYSIDYSRIAGYGYPKYSDTPIEPGTYTASANLSVRVDTKGTAKKVCTAKKGAKMQITAVRINTAGNVWGYANNLGGWVCMRTSTGTKCTKSK